MPRRTKEDNEKGAVLFWQWVQKAKAKQHKQCAHNKKSIFNRGEIMKATWTVREIEQDFIATGARDLYKLEMVSFGTKEECEMLRDMYIEGLSSHESNLTSKLERLPEEFTKVLYENLEDLYS